MNSLQRAKIKGLSLCTFAVGSHPKRFVADMASKPDDYQLTPRQAAYLHKLYWMYRRQINDLKAKGWNLPTPVEVIGDLPESEKA